MKPLKIPKTKQVPGLFTYCNECKRRIGNEICGKTHNDIGKCPNKGKHIFKLSFNIPGTKSVKTKNLDTRNLREATKEAYKFREELEENNFQIPVETETENIQYTVLVDTMKMYIDYLNNVNVPEHLKKDRSKGHINEIMRVFRRFTTVLKRLNYNLDVFDVDQVSQNIIGEYHKYLIEVEKYSNKTYNKYIATMRQFYSWLIEEKDYKISNPFKAVKALPISERNETITHDEFNKLLSVIIPENSRDTRVNYYKYYYKKWLVSAFKLALYTGLRREELFALKWSDIEYNEQNQPLLIKVPNFKVIRLVNGKRVENIRNKWVPVIPELFNLLKNELNLNFNKGSDRFILANDENRNREGLPLFLSKAFGHFWNVSGIKREIRLNDLRNTYITELFKSFGDQAAVITDHSDIRTVKKHYMKAKLISEAAKDFRVF